MSDTIARNTELVAFFRDRSDALSAISELKEAGFTSDQIGLALGGGHYEGGSVTGSSAVSPSGVSGEDSRSMWEKIKDFFSGEHENYHGPSHDYENTFSHLSLSSDQARYYSSGITAGGALVTVKAPAERLAIARNILTDNDADLRTTGFEQTASTSIAPGTSGAGAAEQRLELRGELLRAVKQRVQTGEIRLRKDIVTENQTINVPVTREEVIVERVPASEAGGRAGVTGPIGEGKEVRIPVSEERVSVSKEPVVTGEVRVQKRAVQDTQQVSDTVRREEVRVEKEGNPAVTDQTGVDDTTIDRTAVDRTTTKTGKKKPAA